MTIALLWSLVSGLSLWWNIDWQQTFVAGIASNPQPQALMAEYMGRHLSVLVLVHVSVWVLGMVGLVYGSNQATLRLGAQLRAEKQNRLADHVFNNALEALVVTTGDGTIVRVNPAFTRLTGYGLDEVVGHKANVLRSYHHDDAFYADMWHNLLESGVWQGELKNRRKDGSIFVARENITALWEPGLGKPRYYVASFTDITAQVESQQHIEHLAHYDPLTDLPNRVLFRDRLNHAVTHAGRERRRIAVLFLDLDGFKKVNDTIGHRAGDTLLVEVARRLKACTRSSDTISRLGGDEFALVLERVDTADDVVIVADKLLSALAGSFLLEGREVFVGSSIGISLYPEDGDNAETLLKHADTAMYQAKADGKGRFKFYSADMTRRQEHRLELEGALRLAIENRSFEVHYQPKQRLKGGAIAGFEALVRWNHPSLGMIPPVEFIPLAEELGLITHIDLLVLEQACAMGVQCQEQGHPVSMAVNLSSLDLKNPDLPTLIAGILAQTGLSPHLLVLEITESFAMEVGKGQTEILERLTQLGVSLAIDDFGTGYSSLSYLKELPVESVKIDRSFVRDIGTDSRDTMLVSTIVGLAHSLNLKVVAEGVEDADQKALLHDHNCDEAQGYHVARPMPADQVFGFLRGMAAAQPAD
ncbi:MAG: putative bifunctional diguanylate cyclase/phosphodiesterase [Magnetospirillum sp.]